MKAEEREGDRRAQVGEYRKVWNACCNKEHSKGVARARSCKTRGWKEVHKEDGEKRCENEGQEGSSGA